MSVSTMKKHDMRDRRVVKKDDTQGWATSLLRGILLILNYPTETKEKNQHN